MNHYHALDSSGCRAAFAHTSAETATPSRSVPRPVVPYKPAGYSVGRLACTHCVHMYIRSLEAALTDPEIADDIVKVPFINCTFDNPNASRYAKCANRKGKCHPPLNMLEVAARLPLLGGESQSHVPEAPLLYSQAVATRRLTRAQLYTTPLVTDSPAYWRAYAES
ncbi:hypothetical protein Forpe1208_v002263 [Fusarium oxysporum f. sp. rapae]|uniref:Uncharacterized protein n=1 Tax=Fusarium oxysporum f. sp. rapae TaxID=485398 RepID=A0A8J5P501_FUSOX|nr:hypothetical protein Forpe1208_v002263 [Fusarium oxysporum f. sp. rapae]